ncbi:MAG: response regulator transcription factor, partial [Nitrospirota bacterium]|nr:response regulator transcription factor [Nitrospirota bacterium]
MLPRVIIADDHPEMQEAVALLLKPDFDVLEVVTDGHTALQSVLISKPELLVLDISMPIFTGLDVARRLQAIHSGTKIIFLTVHEYPDIVQEALDAVGSAYVVKSR